MKKENFAKKIMKNSVSLCLIKIFALTSVMSFAYAQEQEENDKSSLDVFRDEIIVTATKREGTFASDQPLSISAFSDAQLDKLHLQDLTDLSYESPNAQVEDIGTAPGVANLTIRGVGINSSIPSVDPTVGVFVDGVYLGINMGVLLDTFDLEGIEVARGPQGVLYGRNVTGGALIVRTKKPTDDFSMTARAKFETGLSRTLSAVVSGPLGDSGLLGRIGVYNNNDEGYFTNLAPNAKGNTGESKTDLVRASLYYENPEGDFDATLRLEYGKQDGDGAIATNHGLYPNDEFKLAIDEEGFSRNDWQMAIFEVNKDVAFGDGKVTNILGYRKLDSEVLSDIDATASFLFHGDIIFYQNQISNELRYAGTFNDFDVTTGLFYFSQEGEYIERRIIPPLNANLIGGAMQDHSTWGVFFNTDYHLNEKTTLTAGLRYSTEEKSADIASILPAALGRCTISGGCTSHDFVDSDSWTSLSPKLGVRYKFDDNTMTFASWTRGFRSGGYNFRNTSPTAKPGPFDQETVDAFEIGLKSKLPNNLGRVSFSYFNNKIADMQREVNTSDPTVGVVQIIQNTADATLSGFEFESQIFLGDNFVLLGSVGTVDASYDKVLYDISGDGVVDEKDKNLDIPRAVPLTYSLSLLADFEVGGIGNIGGRLSFSHRDASKYTDNNVGVLAEADIVNGNLSFTPNGSRFEYSLYGKNLLDEVTWGNDTQLPFFPGASFLPLNKGRVVGIEAVYKF